MAQEKSALAVSAKDIQSGLATDVFGHVVHHFEEVTSTQDEARKLAEKAAREGTLVFAEMQTCGRGRQQRLWVSPRGTGIYLSLILRPEAKPHHMAQMPIVTGLSVRDAIAESIGITLQTKWPNDILFEKKKVAGILTEIKAEPGRIHYLLVGIGINVNIAQASFPKSLQSTATSLSEAVGRTVSRRKLTQSLLVHLEKAYGVFKNQGFEPFRRRWRNWDQTLGALVTIETLNGSTITGHARDLDENGALIIEDGQGDIHCVEAGDATIKNWA
jgi:BirA family biotin operon repressor/biotin-[acetyl-CoA-carboxylase] ligase